MYVISFRYIQSISNITYAHPLRMFLLQQVVNIKGLKRFSPGRKERSMDFIGSAWKWIAGTSDGYDFEILNENQKSTGE